MPIERKITAHFEGKERYFENSIGNEFHFTDVTGPYEYLLGALAGCFYLTLLSLPHKGRWSSVDIEVEGTKRDEIPTTLENTKLKITCRDAEDKDEFIHLVEETKKGCSVYHTISQVSAMSVDVRFA